MAVRPVNGEPMPWITHTVLYINPYTRVPVVVVRGENMGPGVDGLLGLSFLSRYDVTMHRDQGKVRIESRR